MSNWINDKVLHKRLHMQKDSSMLQDAKKTIEYLSQPQNSELRSQGGKIILEEDKGSGFTAQVNILGIGSVKYPVYEDKFLRLF